MTTRVRSSIYEVFQNQWLILKKYQNDIKITQPIKIKRFIVILVWCIKKITCKLKSSEQDYSRQFYPQNYDFAIFVQKKIMHVWQVTSVCFKSSPYEQANLRIWWFSILLFSLQAEKKNTNENFCVLNHFSTYLQWTIFFFRKIFGGIWMRFTWLRLKNRTIIKPLMCTSFRGNDYRLD